jgi:hypothetical protein
VNIYSGTSLLRHETGGGSDTFSGAGIYSEPENKVDLGVLRGADHDGVVLVSPFLTVDRVCVSRENMCRSRSEIDVPLRLRASA